MKTFDEEAERGATRRAFLRLNMLAVAVPVLTLLIFYSYFQLRGIELERSQWKTFALLAWLGTLALLVREAVSVSGYRGTARRQRSAAPQRASRLFTWEGRKARKLCRELLLASLLLPACAAACVTAYVYAANLHLTSRQFEAAGIVLLIGTFLSLVFLTVRAGRSRLIYRAR